MLEPFEIRSAPPLPDTEITELLSEPRPAGWSPEALGVGTGPGSFCELHCAGCGRHADQLAEGLLEWGLVPLDADRRGLAAYYRVCLPCTRLILELLEARLPDLGARPLRGRA
jgi:hypothetical protein